jgi:D-3-phosphoglycerate dehydrogenase
MESKSIHGKIGRLKPRLVLIGQAVNNLELVDRARKHFDVHVFATWHEFLIENLESPYSLWVHFDTTLKYQDFKGMDLPEYLLTTTTGLTHIDSELQIVLGNRLLHLATEKEFLKLVTATAEHTWSLIMAISNPWILKLNTGEALNRASLVRENQLSSRKLGVIGYGRLGNLVSRYALAFGMEVYVYEIDSEVQIPSHPGLTRVSKLEDLLPVCDILTIHASSKYPHHEILSRSELKHSRPGLSIVNTSRGCLVDEACVVELLNKGILDWYATDTLKQEEVEGLPSPSELLERGLAVDKVIVTPHIGGANIEAMQMCEENLLSRLIQFTLKKNSVSED